MLIQLLHNRRMESQREEIAQNAQLSIAAFHSGQLKPQTAEEAISKRQKKPFLNSDSHSMMSKNNDFK